MIALPINSEPVVKTEPTMARSSLAAGHPGATSRGRNPVRLPVGVQLGKSLGFGASDVVVPLASIDLLPKHEKSAHAPGGAAASASDFNRMLLSHIGRFRHYPARARHDHVQGVVYLSFAMTRDGQVTDAWIERTSGSSILDAEALSAIQRAAPLPAIPIDLPDQLSFVMPVSFTLD